MQLMRQDVAISAARGWGGCPANVPKSAARLSRQPARSHRRQPPSTPSLVLEWKELFPVHSTENVEMLHVLQFKSSLMQRV